MQSGLFDMAKIMFCFVGTGDKKDHFKNELETVSMNAEISKIDGVPQYGLVKKPRFHNDVIRVYVRGCENDNVGGNGLFPDLEILANKINLAFDKENKTINIASLEEALDDAIIDVVIP